MTTTTSAQTSALFNQAMDAIRDEMAKTKDMGVLGVGEVMTQLLQLRPGIAAAIVVPGKSLAKAYKALEEYARSIRGKGNVVAFGDQQAVPVLCRYYDIPADAEAPAPAAPEPKPAKPAEPAAGAGLFDLDAMLGV